MRNAQINSEIVDVKLSGIYSYHCVLGFNVIHASILYSTKVQTVWLVSCDLACNIVINCDSTSYRQVVLMLL